MMSEQGRCFVPVVLQLPEIACLHASGWSIRASWSLAGHLLPVPPAGASLAVGPPDGEEGGHFSWCIMVAHPSPHHFGFFILHYHLSFRAVALLGCLRERSMKQGMMPSIMGVNEANFRATKRLTSSCSSPDPVLGPQVGDRHWASPWMSLWVKVCIPSSLHPTAPCNF